ncbi:MAG: SDR family NAD(P)-dependent oxidoreductase [Candidatus Binatus sp.]|uniref:SDR family oxidoreductase n=1 Tax=Candidatus Binatus sp. TaxID=2811406 RepID=UPI003BBECA3C
MDRVDGKTAFITGGARGIGLGIARAFARSGAKLALADLDQASLVTAKSELSDLTTVETFKLDVRDRSAYARVADETESRLGPVSILCNNAGVAGDQHVTRLTYEYWDWVIGINLHGVINGIQTFLPRMLNRGGGGHIVNTASGAGLAATSSGLLYTTSKFAVVGLSESLRNALEPFKIGVSVLCPGPVNTKIISNSRETQPPTQVTAEEAKVFETIITQVNAVLAAGVDPDEVGEMVLAAVKANRLYIHTDRIMAGLIEARTRMLLDAMPPASKSRN